MSSAPQEFVSMPVMHCLKALVKEPFDYLVAVPQGTLISVGAGPDPETPGRALLFIGLQGEGGRMLTAIIPEQQLPVLSMMLSDASDRMRRLDFENATAGAA